MCQLYGKHANSFASEQPLSLALSRALSVFRSLSLSRTGHRKNARLVPGGEGAGREAIRQNLLRALGFRVQRSWFGDQASWFRV